MEIVSSTWGGGHPVGGVSLERAERPERGSQRAQHRGGVRQALRGQEAPAQNVRRAYVTLGRAAPLRDGLRSQVCRLCIAMSCYEVSQPDAGPSLVNSRGWGGSVPTQHIRPQ
jgi:hypothetical protein